MGVDLLAEPAGGAERQPKELQLVGRGPRAVGEQLEALLAHFRIRLIGEQFDPVVERPDRRQEVVAKPRAQQTGKIDRVHRKRLMGQSLIGRKFRDIEDRRPKSHISM